MTELGSRFSNEIKRICTTFDKGLSNTSTRKFDQLVPIVSEMTDVAEENIYITAAASRASNLWNRLAQGKPLTQHFSLALGIIDAENLQGGISSASRFIGDGVGHYDAIALAIKVDEEWSIGAVLDSEKLSIYEKLKAVFPDNQIQHEIVTAETNNLDYAWFVGGTGADENDEWHDFSDQYISEGTWENHWKDKFIETVKSIEVGDRIALKACFTQKNDLPFNSNGKTVAAMRIKAIGTVTENAGDGKNIKVEWERLDPTKTWFGPGTLRETIHKVCAEDGYIRSQLLDFTFEDADQDYSICEEYYAENTPGDLLDNEENGIGNEGEADPIVIDETKRKTGGANIILYGVPGAGKSWTIGHDYCKDESRMERLVFHPDYMYSDFIGQILPVVGDDNKVRYEFTPGPFTKILKKAYEDYENKYWLIIEEINRGNAPAIFGEVFQLLDRISETGKDYPVGTSEYGITNSNIAKIVYGYEKKVRIPSNLYIIGTMNTSDQNVFTLDTAFQRRWIMRMIPNSFDNHKFADNPILDTTVSWKAFCKAINDEVLHRNNVTSSEDKRLGAYFISGDDLIWHGEEDDPEADKSSEAWIDLHLSNKRFAEKVLKYLWDDAFKFAHPDIFDTPNYMSLEMIIDKFCNSRGNTRFDVFHENVRKSIFEMAHEYPALNQGTAENNLQEAEQETNQ